MVCASLIFLLVLCGDGVAGTFSIPSHIYLAHLLPSVSSQEILAFQFAISHVNADPQLLPNTTLSIVTTDFSEEDPITYATEAADRNISALIVSDDVKISHESLGAVLATPLVTTRPLHAVPANQMSVLFGISSGLSPTEIGSAIVAIIQKYDWKSLIVLYDVPWRGHVSVFLAMIPSTIHYQTSSVRFGKDGTPDTASRNQLGRLSHDTVEAIVLFCHTKQAKIIIDIVHDPRTHRRYPTHYWVLADSISSPSVHMTTEHSQVVIGLGPRIANNTYGDKLSTALSTNRDGIKFSSFLVYDAVLVLAHALHGILVANKWDVTTSSANLVTSRNGVTLLEYMKQVSITGTTGLLQFDSGGNRRNAKIDVYNLRSDVFTKIGEWSSASGLSTTSAPIKNSLNKTIVVPLSELKRKIRVPILTGIPPFIISEKDPTTGAVKYTGHSIDLLDILAGMNGFQYEIYESAELGGVKEDGTYYGLFGDIQSEKADLTTLPLTINSARLQYLDFSEPFMHVSMDLVTRKPEEKQIDITGFMTPYTIPVWLMTMACWIFVTGCLSLVNYYSPYGHRLRDTEGDGDEFSFFNSLWFCLASMLQQGGDATPKMLSGRIVTGTLWFVILVWVSTYTANLAAFLTTSSSDSAINNLEDVLDKEYNLYITKDTALYHFFRQSDYRIYRLLFERMVAGDTFLNFSVKGEDLVRKMDKTVFLDEDPFTDYSVKQEPCDLMTVKGLMGSSSYGIVMPKQSPYLLNISRSILKLQENGKLEDLRRKWWVERTKCPEYRKLTSDEIIENMRIQIGSMVGVYVVLAMGGIAGVVVLLIELEWKKRRDRLKAKVQQGWKTMRATKTVMALQKKSKDDGDGEDVKKKAAIQAFGMPLNTPSKKWGAKNSDTPDGGRQSRQRKGSEKAIIMDMETSA